MIRIGDFSKLSQLSVKTLRYYDELGLLKPVQVDPFTSYRYYAASQLPRLQAILNTFVKSPSTKNGYHVICIQFYYMMRLYQMWGFQQEHCEYLPVGRYRRTSLPFCGPIRR